MTTLFNKIYFYRNQNREWTGTKVKLKKIMLLAVIIIAPLIFLYIMVNQIQMYRYSQMEVPDNSEYLIILGARVKGTEPSVSLLHRIQVAAKYLQENQHTIAIASGGQGPGEEISEAEAIQRALIEEGIDRQRIKIENKSTSTFENISFSKEHIPDSSVVGIIVTNDYHLYRATLIANDHELNVRGLPAKAPISVIFQSYIREHLALTKYFLTKIIDL
ncbi:YdcF family protein [Halalkalibacter kiskunsagensis]|uniref:YdcF family protein n=1 Tax=Halalkalibacter kiskunsagensis TaxID=1548599 RepID=A0ABV6KG79_9BACI